MKKRKYGRRKEKKKEVIFFKTLTLEDKMLKLFLVYSLPLSLIVGSGTRVGLAVVESTTELILISFLSVRIGNVLKLQFNPNPSAYATNFIHSSLRFSYSRFFPLLHFNKTLKIGFFP